MRIISALSLACAVLAAGTVFAAETQRKVAIIVENRAGANLNDKVSVLEDLVTSRIAGKGFAVVSRDVAINALKTYPSLGISATAKSDTDVKATSAPDHAAANVEAAQANSATIAATPETTKLDQALSDNTSALRLAQNLGVDFILIPSITSYGTEKKSYTGNGIQTLNTIHRLRVSYKIVEANEGGALRGGTFVSEKTTRDTGSLQTDSTDTLNELLDDAADQLADAITASAQFAPDGRGQSRDGEFSHCLHDDRSAPATGADFRRRHYRRQHTGGHQPAGGRATDGCDGGTGRRGARLRAG